MVFLLLVMLLAMVFFQVWTTLPLHLRAFYDTGERSIGLLLSVNAALIVLFEMLLIRAVEHFDSLRTIGVGSFLVCAGLALVPLGPPYAVAVAAMVVLTVGEMLALPVSNTVVAERAGRARTGRAMGLYTLAFSAAFVVGPVAGTAVYESFGAPALWYGIGCIGVVLWLAFSALAPAFRRPA
jgi:MFS family permease